MIQQAAIFFINTESSQEPDDRLYVRGHLDFPIQQPLYPTSHFLEQRACRIIDEKLPVANISREHGI